MVEAAVAWDLDTALAHLRHADPVLASLAARYRPELRWYPGSRFHALASAIVAQQLSGKAAATISARLRQAVAAGGELRPELILTAEHESLRSAGLSSQKARYLCSLAEAVLGGSLDLEALDQLPDDEVIATLTRVKGIGAWTAEMFLIFSLGRPDVLSAGDLGIRTAVQRHYGLLSLPRADELRSIAEPWRPYRSAALLLLWHSLDNAPEIARDEQAPPR